MMRSLLLLLFVLSSAGGFSQSAGFLHFSVEDGLPQSQVTSLSQDLKGNLWIGTISGASRFDGVKFKTFNSKNGLAENWVTCASSDKKGNVWFGHWNGGISIADANGHEAHKLVVPDMDLQKPVNCILQINDSLVLIGTDGNGLHQLNINSNRLTKIEHGLEPNTSIRKLFTANGNLYIASSDALFSLSDLPSLKSTVSEIVKGTDISAVAVSGELILYADHGRLYKVTPGAAPVEIKGPQEVRTIMFDKNSRVWISTYGFGVFVFNDLLSGDEGYRVFNEKQGLSFDFSNLVFQDRDENIWIGTDLGLDILAGEKLALYDKSSGIENNLVWSVLAARSGAVYAGTGDGLFIKENGSANFSRVNIPALTGRSIVTLFQDVTSRIWAGTMNSGLFIIKDNRLEKHLGPDSGYPFEKINRIAEQNDGSIWVATDRGAGRIDHEGKITFYTTDNGLLHEYVTTIYVDSKDRVWFGYTGEGMQSLSSGRFTVPFTDSLLKTATVLSIIEDRVGHIWAGAFGDGLFMFDGQKVKNIRVNDGTNSDSPLSLYADEKNRIWFGTNRGIDCFDPVTQRFQHYGKKRGFLGVETNINAIMRDKNGSLWFGCLMGALKMDATDEVVPANAPFPTIDEVKLFFQKSVSGDPVFKHDSNHLTFGFSSVYLKDPEKLRYQYMLEGYDKDWSALTVNTSATYPNLPPGKYRFLVKSGFIEGVWSAPVEYSFEIDAPFWKTWWFNALLIGAVTTFLMLLIELKSRRSKKNKKALELLVRERTIELGQKNMELAMKNKELSEALKRQSQIQ